MGITGLIPFLEKASCPINIRQYKGQTVAIDAYCWLHRGIFSCAEKIARGEKCDQYITYCLKYVNMLISHDIKPILVFDGRYLPAKAATEKKRRQSREQNKAKAAELLRQGRTAEARRCLRNSVDVGPGMAAAVARACRSVGADCIFAPFEADAQLAYLTRKGIAAAVITEDSDLILFGCLRVIFKLDLSGSGLEVVQDRLHLAMGVTPERFSMDRFRQMCILSGCDYLDSLPGIGLAKAKKFVNTTSSPDISQALGKIPSALSMYSLNVTEEYMKKFRMADATFLYQIVYDPVKRSAVPLNNPEEISIHDDLAEKIRGKLHPPETELQLALGNLDPFTLSVIDDFNADGPRGPYGGGIGKNGPSKRKWKSIWDKDFTPWGNSKTFHSQDALMNVERVSTWGKDVVMSVSFLQAPSADNTVKGSPRKRKSKLEPAEEDLCKETSCTDADLGMLYGSPPTKRSRTETKEKKESDEALQILLKKITPKSPLKKVVDNQEEIERRKEEESESGVFPESGESCKENSSHNFEDISSENSSEVVSKQSDDWLETLEKVTPKTPPKDKKDSEDSGIVCGSSPNGEDNSPTSPIIGSKRKVNPFAKPFASAKESPKISGGILSSSKMFSKVQELGKTAEGMKVVVKSRYFASSTASFTNQKDAEIEEITEEQSRASEREDILSCKTNVMEKNVEEKIETMAEVIQTYSKLEVKPSSPPEEVVQEIVQSSPRKILNPFPVEKKSPKNCSVYPEKPEDEEDKLAGPRKPLFNWGSLQAKFSFEATTNNEVIGADLQSSNLMIGQVNPVSGRGKSPLGSSASPSPGRGRGRGNTCKRLGLARSSTPKMKPTIQGTSNQQSLLSRFGFQKKS